DVPDFIVSGRWLAFRAVEPSDGPDTFVDLNGDGDANDTVMLVYDLGTRTLINTGQAVVNCELPGCEPGLPYKIVGDTLAFLTRECDQGGPVVSASCPGGGTDLNGDQDADDTVVQIFELRTHHSQIIDMPTGSPSVPPLPVKFIDS